MSFTATNPTRTLPHVSRSVILDAGLIVIRIYHDGVLVAIRRDVATPANRRAWGV